MKSNKNYSIEDIETLKKLDNNLINKYPKKFNYFNLIFIIVFIVLVIIEFLNIKKNIENLEKSFNKKIQNLEEYIKNQDKTIKNQENIIKKVDYKSLILSQQIEIFFSYLDNIKNESCIYQILKPKGVVGKNKVRIGAKGDGGYVLLDDFKNIKIAYSFGISNEISFDKELAD